MWKRQTMMRYNLHIELKCHQAATVIGFHCERGIFTMADRPIGFPVHWCRFLWEKPNQDSIDENSDASQPPLCAPLFAAIRMRCEFWCLRCAIVNHAAVVCRRFSPPIHSLLSSCDNERYDSASTPTHGDSHLINARIAHTHTHDTHVVESTRLS